MYPLGAQVMTTAMPLGFFIVVMAAYYVVFTRPHTIPGHQDGVLARPQAPDVAVAGPVAAAGGFPTATGAGGPEPLADRATPPVAGAAKEGAAAEPGEAGAGSAEAPEESE
jgi:hypothetical protein